MPTKKNSEIKETERKIRLILKDLKPLELDDDPLQKFNGIQKKYFSNPPHYLVRLILIGILDFKNYGRWDTIYWHTFLEYRRLKFAVHDNKFGSWTISSKGTIKSGVRPKARNKKVEKLEEEIHGKIEKAAKKLNPILKEYFETKKEKENFYLNNVYSGQLKPTFDFFKEKVEDSIRKYREMEEDIVERLQKNHNIWFRKKQEKKISYFTFALMSSFYSILEFLLDAFYAFEQKDIEFDYFKKKSWDWRFKQVLPEEGKINENKELKKIYDDIFRVKEDYRNPLSHGLSNKANLLFKFPGAGLVPLSYEYLEEKINYNLTIMEIEESENILRTFEHFFNFLQFNEPYRFFLEYIGYSDFPIPLDSKEIEKIKNKMKSPENFEIFLERKAKKMELIINREI